MTPKASGRTQQCGREQARVRLTQARAFLEVAELIDSEEDDLAHPGVAASLAGIAAADAGCCIALGERPRGKDHRQAVDLVRTIAGHGGAMARALDRLLDIKDGAHYGMVFVGSQKAKAAVKQAQLLVDGAEAVFRS
ncbi:hypothetical protein EV646_107376 [Kribbella antiqua]|uniref:HEPN domain-containing protein n=1 Tax=Kribbella antiqua TaxID=2512217 RepID=A0A4R2IME8_9ACTN|nr:hypothetical protein [Kribbella antiqua]TCO46351.1 hypothetical protein EV646_107376 [Kribbella antiqua]